MMRIHRRSPRVPSPLLTCVPVSWDLILQVLHKQCDELTGRLATTTSQFHGTRQELDMTRRDAAHAQAIADDAVNSAHFGKTEHAEELHQVLLR